MIYNHFILSALWLLYCFVHSFLANDDIKRKFKKQFNFNDNLYRIFYNLFALISLSALFFYHFSLTSILLFVKQPVTIGFAVLFIAAGVIIMLICIKKYFLQLSGFFKNKNEFPVLETLGMHRYTRHPLYLGTFIFLIGLVLFAPLLSNLIAVIIIIVYTIIGIQFEEKKLIALFGDDYRRYKKEVPKLIPFIKKI